MAIDKKRYPRLANDKRYEYTLIDKHYRSDDFKSGRAFKEFFDEFAKGVFEANLAMLEGIDDFPIAWSENNAYASISHSLHQLTPYTYGEVRIDYKNKKMQVDEPKSDEKWRFVDFWAMSERKTFELWMEVKRIWLNIGSGSKGEFDKNAKELIDGALEQIFKIKESQKQNKLGATADTQFKVALFTIPIFCHKTRPATEKSVDDAPKLAADLLAEFLTRRDTHTRNMGVLCAMLDLDPHCKKKDSVIYIDEYTPYFVLGAVVLE